MRMKLSEIARNVGGEIIGNGEAEITGVAKIEEARQGEITFLANPKYAKFLETSNASAVIVPMDITDAGGKFLIRTKNPYYAFLQIVSLFHPSKPLIEKGIHKTAIIGEETDLGNDLSIGPYVVIGRRCRIGDGTVFLPGVVVGDDVIVGEGCTLHARVCLRERVVIGNRVIFHNGAVVGSDGFGFAPEEGRYYKIPQIGTVVIEDDVEIGANTTIDRATLGETRIKRGAKLDNLIQVGHNCTVGEDTVIAAQTGLSGSTHIGKGVRVGGQVGFAGHLNVGDAAAIGAQSGVSKSIPAGTTVFGYPARPHAEEFRIMVAQRRLPQVLKEMKELKERIQRLEALMRKEC
jgi:UDP-3-O-[3-hydroxymyristoyl] glucosamine N-acyltransferase